MEHSFLKDYTEKEKIAYIGTVASLAIADNVATTEEIEIVSTLIEVAGITGIEKERVLKTAKGLEDADFDSWMATLKHSELRFSLIAELISFARTDGQYSSQERKKIEEISTHLGINNEQYAVLDEFVTKSGDAGETNKPGFLDSLGMGNMFSKAGISMSGFAKGLLAIAAPMLLAKLFGSRKGGLMGGAKSALGVMVGTAGLTSLVGMLSGGRGFSKTGGLLSKLLQKKH